MRPKQKGFTIVELLIVIVVIGILAALVITTFSGTQKRARDAERISKLKYMAKAVELYYIDNGRYPPVIHGVGVETSCGSQTENWGHCDRNKALSDALAPYIKIDPTSLSNATQGNYYYYYTSHSGGGYQSYGMQVYLESTGGQNDGGYHANTYEVGPMVSYCMAKYTGTGRDWTPYITMCAGGD